MRRIKLLAALFAILAVMALGTGAAQAYWGWYWNAEIDLEGTSLRTAWTVTDGDQDDYFAYIRVSVPRKAKAELLDLAEGHERVKISTQGRLSCDRNSVDAIVTFNVKAVGKGASRKGNVEVDITANGKTIGVADGRLGKRITLKLDVPAKHPRC
jgi:hypothetical protein